MSYLSHARDLAGWGRDALIDELQRVDNECLDLGQRRLILLDALGARQGKNGGWVCSCGFNANKGVGRLVAHMAKSRCVTT